MKIFSSINFDCRSKWRNRGSALLSVILISILLSLLTAGLWSLMLHTGRRAEFLYHGQIARSEAKKQALLKSLTQEVSRVGISCTNAEVRAGQMVSAAEFCAARSPESPATVFNFAGIFSNQSKCLNLLQSQAKSEGFSTIFTCTRLEANRNILVSRHNLKLDAVTLHENDPNIVPTVAALGRLEIGSLIIDSDSLIIAGGDMSIGQIVNSSAIPVTISIMSGRGSVRLEAAQGRMDIYPRASGKIELPINARIAPIGPLPPILQFEPLGFKHSE